MAERGRPSTLHDTDTIIQSRGTKRPGSPLENPRTFYSHFSDRRIAESDQEESSTLPNLQFHEDSSSGESSAPPSQPIFEVTNAGESVYRMLDNDFWDFFREYLTRLNSKSSPPVDSDIFVRVYGDALIRRASSTCEDSSYSDDDTDIEWEDSLPNDSENLRSNQNGEREERGGVSMFLTAAESLFTQELEAALTAHQARAGALDYDVDMDINTMPADGQEEYGGVVADPNERYAHIDFSFDGYEVDSHQLPREAQSPSVLPGASISTPHSHATVQASNFQEGTDSPIGVQEDDDLITGYEADDEATVFQAAERHYRARPILSPRRIDFDVRCRIRDGCKFCRYSIPHGRLRTREPSLYHLRPFRMTTPTVAGALPQDELTRRLRYHIDALSRWNTLELELQTFAVVQDSLIQLRHLLVEHLEGRILTVEEREYACNAFEVATTKVFKEVLDLFDVAAKENRRILDVSDGCHCELERDWIDLGMAAKELGYDKALWHLHPGRILVDVEEQSHWERSNVFWDLEIERRMLLVTSPGRPCMLVHW